LAVFWFLSGEGNTLSIFFICNYLRLLNIENQDSSPKAFIETAEEYAKTKGKLIKLQVVQTISDTTSSLVSGFILLLIVNMALLLLSVGIAIWIGSCTG